MYQVALHESGSTEQLQFITSYNNRENSREEKKQHKRKIICFNPLYSLIVRSNIGKIFLKLMRKHFQNGNPLHKLLKKC